MPDISDWRVWKFWREASGSDDFDQRFEGRTD